MTDLTMHRLQKTFEFPFKDPHWGQKLFITTGLILANFIIPIIPSIFLAGYFSVMVREILARNGEPFLPEWTDWDRYLSDGIKLAGVGFIMMLPVIIIFSVGYSGIMLTSFLTPLLEEYEEYLSIWFVLNTGGLILSFLFMGIGMLFSLAIGFISPAVLMHVARRNEFSAGFQYSEWWKIFRANLSGYLIAFIIMLGAYSLNMILAQFLYMSVILCCLLPIISSIVGAYITWIWTALYTQVYLDGTERMGAGAQISVVP